MSESNRALQEFVAFLSSPDMYGSMSQVSMMMKWAIHAVVTILMLAAVVALIFVVLKLAADIIMLTGAGDLMASGKEGKVQRLGNKISGFASEHAVKADAMEYLKHDVWKIILVLAMIGMLASGMLLPLAGQLAGAIGAGVDKMLQLDPATQIENFDVGDFSDRLDYTRSNDLKTQYDKASAEVKTYRDYIYDLGAKNVSDENVTLQKYKRLYTNAYVRANMISGQMDDTKLQELKVPKSYFEQHSKNGMCNDKFFVKGMYENANSASQLVCGT